MNIYTALFYLQCSCTRNLPVIDVFDGNYNISRPIQREGPPETIYCD